MGRKRERGKEEEGEEWNRKSHTGNKHDKIGRLEGMSI